MLRLWYEQSRKLGLPLCQMPDYWCFLVGGNNAFSLVIDQTETVDYLKKEIKKENPAELKDVDAATLTLYRVEVDAYDKQKQKRINEFKRLSQNLNECMELDDEQQLSECFGENLPQGKRYYIIVQPPEGESIYCGGVVLIADVVKTQMSKLMIRPPPPWRLMGILNGSSHSRFSL